jgi:ubiquinol-cytochrome c reductase cytochrome c1 subunit
MNKYFSKKRGGRLAVLLISGLLISSVAVSEEAEGLRLEHARVDLSDLPALQRGAQLFMNHCSGCHSLKYVRYQTMAEDLGIVNSDGQLLSEAIKGNLMFVGDQLADPIKSAMPAVSGAAWFGVAPPDLSLVARSRGLNWLYTYLRSFYADPKRPWGVNNRVFPDVAMPDVLSGLRSRLLAQENGTALYDRAVLDIVHFLAYAGEPMQVKRRTLGIWVLLFLGIFCVFAVLLKREYWKDIH